MLIEQTRVTSKFQATIPRSARTVLGLKPGETVTWHPQVGRVFVDVHKKIKNPAKFLTTQPRTGVDIMKLLREFRDEIG